jgi:hypothetical protein
MDVGRPRRQAYGADRAAALWVAVLWARAILGIVLAAIGGVAFGQAWANESVPWWAVGGITLLAGALLVLSGLYARSHPPRVSARVIVEEEPAESQEPQMPLLGALLVYKYHLITRAQLEDALREQKRTKPRRRLGEILVLKGLITVSELEEALAFQDSSPERVLAV